MKKSDLNDSLIGKRVVAYCLTLRLIGVVEKVYPDRNCVYIAVIDQKTNLVSRHMVHYRAVKFLKEKNKKNDARSIEGYVYYDFFKLLSEGHPRLVTPIFENAIGIKVRVTEVKE